MSHPINWFHISTKDVKGAQKIPLKSVFGWKMSAGPGGTIMVAPEKGGIPGGDRRGHARPVDVMRPSTLGPKSWRPNLKKEEKAGGRGGDAADGSAAGHGAHRGVHGPGGSIHRAVGGWETSEEGEEGREERQEAGEEGSRLICQS